MIDIRKLAEKASEPDTVPAFQNGFWTLTQGELATFAALVLEEAAKECDAQNGMQGIVWDQAVEACADTIRAMKPGKPS